MQDEKIKILLEMAGTQGVDDLNVKLAKTDKELKDLADTYKLGGIALEEYLKKGQKLLYQQEELQNAIGKTASTAGRDFAGLGRELSRGFEDLTTGGPLGILNNIPGIFTQIGKAAQISATSITAMAAAASGLATVGYILYRNWDSVKELIGSKEWNKALEFFATFLPIAIQRSGDKMADLKKQIEDLEKKKYKVAIDYSQIDLSKKKLAELERAHSAFEALQKATTKTQDEASKLVKEGITESGDANKSGGEKVVDALATAEKNRGTFYSTTSKGQAIEDVKNRMNEAAKQYNEQMQLFSAAGDKEGKAKFKAEASKAFGKQRQELNKLMAEASTEKRNQLGDMVGLASSGDQAAIKNITNMYNADQGAFQGLNKFAAGLILASPENMAADKANDKSVRKQQDEAKAKKEQNATNKQLQDDYIKKQDVLKKKEIKRKVDENKEIADNRDKDRKAILDADPKIIAEYENVQIGIDRSQGSKREKAGARDRTDADLKRLLFQDLLARGFDPGEAEVIANQGPAFLTENFENKVNLSKIANTDAAPYQKMINEGVNPQKALETIRKGGGAAKEEIPTRPVIDRMLELNNQILGIGASSINDINDLYGKVESLSGQVKSLAGHQDKAKRQAGNINWQPSFIPDSF